MTTTTRLARRIAARRADRAAVAAFRAAAPERRNADANRLVGRTGAPEQQRDAGRRRRSRSESTAPGPAGSRPLRAAARDGPQHDVVGEDHAEAEHEAREPPVLPMADAEREADERQHQATRPGSQTSAGSCTAGCGPDRSARAPAAMLALSSAMLISRSRLRRRDAGEHRVRIEVDDRAVVVAALVLVGLRRPTSCATSRSVSSSATSRFSRSTRRRPSFAKYTVVCPGWEVSARNTSRQPPGDDVAGIDGPVGELSVEHARLDVALRAIGDDVEGDLAERLIRVGQCDNDLVGRGQRWPATATKRHRPDQAERADAARLHRHELAIGRQAAEADQDPEQHRHRNGEG